MTKRNPSVSDRQGYIGGSDAAAILGLSPYCSPMQLFGIKRGLDVKMPIAPALEARFYFGHLLEDSIGKAVTHYYGIKLKRIKQFVRCEQYPFIGGHIDWSLTDGSNAFVECKNVRFDSDEWAEDFSATQDCSTKIPVYYLAQCDHYMLVRDCTHCYLAALIGGCELRVYRICREPTREKILLDAELDFWARIENDDPPFGKSAEDFIAAVQYGYVEACTSKEAKKKDPITVGPELEKRLHEASEAKRVIKKQYKLVDAVRKEVIEHVRDFGYLCNSKGENLGSLLTSTRHSFDDFAFKLKHPDLYEQFLREAKVVTLRIKGGDDDADQ